MQPFVRGYRQWGTRFRMLSPGARIVLGLLGIVTAVTLGSALFGPSDDQDGNRTASADRTAETNESPAVLGDMTLPPLEEEDGPASASAVSGSPHSEPRRRAPARGTEVVANRGMSLDAAATR